MKINETIVNKAAALCRQRGIIIPTFAQMREPSRIADKIKHRLKSVGLWDVDPVNLFRISWKNEPVAQGGLYGEGNWIEFPKSLTGVDARIVGIVGKWFPTGAHKVGAAFGCIVPRLVTGEFDPTSQKAVWPSTGNYCRGGAFDCALLGCHAVGILPEEMSRERFDWLHEIGAEVIATPGCESNVKEIYDKCWEIRKNRPDCVIFNQFEEFGNAIWHYHVTGGNIDDIFRRLEREQIAAGGRPLRMAGYISSTGSAGTIAAGDFLKTKHPNLRTVACEALQCPTLLQCGFGAHRIEGIGDKHIPWIHNVRTTDAVAAIDDEQCIALMRLFNEEQGQQFLIEEGVAPQFVAKLPDVGISGICNLVTAIKTARMFDMDARDVIFTPLTDSMGLYGSRIEEYRKSQGPYSIIRAARDYERWLLGTTPDHMRELTYFDRKMLHNFKYFTWVEQQQRSVDDLRKLWDPDFWSETFAQVEDWDRMIEAFNQRVGVI